MAITLEKALEMIEAAKKKAVEIGVPMCVAVVDSGGNLKAFERMEDSLLASLDISINKAYTAVALKTPTQDLASATQPGQSLYGLQNCNSGRIVIFGGGIPLKKDGILAGAVGVSGGSVEEDVQCATAAVACFND
jgi:cob(I)alamin adenosyltransferase